jgi:hypothetical protein
MLSMISIRFAASHDQEGEELEDVTAMRRGTQQFMDGIGILGYDNVDAVASELDRIDRIRFQYPWASDPAQRCMFGSMPSMT